MKLFLLPSLCCCAVLWSVLFVPATLAKEDIKGLEARLAAMAPGAFDYMVHEKLRQAYLKQKDGRSAMNQVDAILAKMPFDRHMHNCLLEDQEDPKAHFLFLATDYAGLPNLSASCWAWAAALEVDTETRRACIERAHRTKRLSPAVAKEVEQRWLRMNRIPRAWKPFAKPDPAASLCGPWDDPDDLTRWPNQTSRANSDPWLVRNHDRIREMRPRVLVINFSNEHELDHLKKMMTEINRAIAESSRFQGYKNPKAPAFLNYQIFKFVDLSDINAGGNGPKVPLKDPDAKEGFNMDYEAYFSADFARAYGIRDPDDPKRYLLLEELLDGGYKKPHVSAYNLIEICARYDEAFRKTGDYSVHPTTGFHSDLPWIGRSVRFVHLNASRGVGCFLGSLSEGVDRMGYSDDIPYLEPYMAEYTGNNLRERYDLPFSSLRFADSQALNSIKYPGPKKMAVRYRGKEFIVEPYIPIGGTLHYPPNARSRYDTSNAEPVLSLIQGWRTGPDPSPKPFSNADFAPFEKLAPDCMDGWFIYWRQNMPGLDNDKFDDDGKPMKNWWPFLFY